MKQTNFAKALADRNPDTKAGREIRAALEDMDGAGGDGRVAIRRARHPKKQNRHRIGRLELPVSDATLMLLFPGIRLLSVNQMIGSAKKGPQMFAHDQAKQAVRGLTLRYRAGQAELWRFDLPVEITVVQVLPSHEVMRVKKDKSRVVDAENLYSKHLIDRLTARGGIGVIEDDGHEWVRGCMKRNERGVEMGVRVVLRVIRGGSERDYLDGLNLSDEEED